MHQHRYENKNRIGGDEHKLLLKVLKEQETTLNKLSVAIHQAEIEAPLPMFVYMRTESEIREALPPLIDRIYSIYQEYDEQRQPTPEQ